MAQAVLRSDASIESTPVRFDLSSIEAGVPIETLTAFAASSGIAMKDLYQAIIPARTLKHRRARKEPLSRDESDKLARVVRVFNRTVEVFGNPEKALRWLGKPKERFDGRTPFAMLRTDLGGRMVEELIGQIAEGFFA